MAAPEGNQNAAGNHTPKSGNRKLAADVRENVLKIAYNILIKPRVEMNEEDYELWKETYLKLLGSVLPRQTALTNDEDDEPPIIQLVNYADYNKLTPEEIDRVLKSRVEGFRENRL